MTLAAISANRGTILRQTFPKVNSYQFLQKMSSSAQQVFSQRKISSVAFPRSVEQALAGAKSSFSRYTRLNLHEKAALLVSTGISDSLGYENNASETIEQQWNRLRANESTNFSSLPPYSSDPLENFQAFFQINNHGLLKEGVYLQEYSSKDYIRTPTELLWVAQPPSIPFTKEGSLQKHSVALDLKNSPTIEMAAQLTEEDAVGAWTIATPHLDATTLVYEHGCWNGTNLLGLLLYAYEHHKHPGFCTGSDINFSSLNIAQALASSFGLPPSFIQFHLSNALAYHPVNLETLNCRKQLLLALRLIPVLTPQDAEQFLTLTKNTMTSGCTLIVSYALPKGKKYEQNLALAASSNSPINRVSLHINDHGALFIAPFEQPDILSDLVSLPNITDQVVNCYYSSQGFDTLVRRCGLKIVESLTVGEHSDNYRAVVALRIQ